MGVSYFLLEHVEDLLVSVAESTVRFGEDEEEALSRVVSFLELQVFHYRDEVRAVNLKDAVLVFEACVL
jgi:hypothetical protein